MRNPLPASPRPRPVRDHFGAVAALLCLALLTLAACVGAPPGKTSDSYASFNRTFEAARGAMSDQQMTFSVENLRQGKLVGMANGTTISATLDPQLDGTIRVLFVNQDATPADPGLLKRVVDAYNTRISATKLLPGIL